MDFLPKEGSKVAWSWIDTAASFPNTLQLFLEFENLFVMFTGNWDC